ncbi:MAG: GAF domain-containing protein [Chloroflexi bacterium]|nr:GAF domain-containing protein [Chloroflexota bacterium]
MQIIRRWISPLKDLGMQLLFLYLLIIIPALIVLFGFDQLAGRKIRENVKASDLSLARAIALETNLSISKSMQAVEGLSQHSGVLSANTAEMEDVFSVFLQTRPDANLIYRLDESGVMLYHYPIGENPTIGNDFSFRNYYQNALLSKEALVSKGRISPTTNQAVATTVMPIWDDDDFLGVVATNIKLASLSKTLNEIISTYNPEEGFEIVILDSKAQIIAYPDADFLLQNAKSLLPQVYAPSLAGENGTLIANNDKDEERLYTYAPIPSAGWSVIVSRPTETAFATQIAIHRIAIIVAITFALIGFFIWILLARHVVNPIERLASLSRSIGSTQGVSKEERKKVRALSIRPDQIGYLIRSILRMEESIAKRINEQETLLETSKAVVSTLDPEIVLDRILQQVQKLFDVNMCAIVALDEEQNNFRIRASRGLSKRYAVHIAIQPTDPNSITMRALRSKEPIQISDTKKDPSFTARLPRAEAEGYRSILAVPLTTQHAPPAALLVFRPDPHLFTFAEIQLLANFANHVAMAIENATLYARSDMRLQEQTRRIEALVHSLSDGLILSTLSGNVVYANRRVGELADLSPEELHHTSTNSVIDRLLVNTPDRKRIRQEIDNALKNEKEKGVEIPLELNNRKIYLRLQIFDVTDTKKKPIGRGLIFRDFTTDREVDRMKSSLIATVSHELRTPLAAIKGYATTLLAEDVEWDSASQRDFLSIISAETDRLSDLVSSLLDLSRIESGNITISRIECPVEELIQRASKSSGLQESNKLKITLTPNLPTLFADPQRLETILRNLLENAIKYAGEDAAIQVKVSNSEGIFTFCIKDNGPGIPSEESEHIFQSFYRLDASLTRVVSGAGLGLAICQGLVRAHGGEIWSEPQPEGACIVFSIPSELPETERLV